MFADAAEIIFEVAWTSSPLDTAPTWVDESAYVRVEPSIRTRRGRQSELEEFSYGVLSVELNNRTRRFDPTYSAGALYGNLLPRKQCRLRLKWAGTTYDVFKGWLTGIPQNYGEGGMDATVTLEAVDALALLGEMGLTLDTYTTAADGIPFSYRMWRVLSGTTWVEDDGTADYVMSSGTAGFGGASPVSPSGVASLSLNSGYTWTSTVPSSTSTDAAWGFWLRTSLTPASATPVIRFDLNGGSDILAVAINTDGTLSWTKDGVSATTTFAVNDGISRYFTCVCAGSTAPRGRLYVNGVSVATAAFTANGGIQAPNKIGNATLATAGEVLVQDFVVISDGDVFTDAEMASLYQGAIGQIVEPTTTRAARYLDNVAWPATWRDLAPTTGLGGSRGECADVQQSGYAHNALKVAAATEQGRYFATKDGDVAFYGRYYAFEVTRGSTVQATFSDDGAGISYLSTGIDWSDREVNNDVTVTWSSDPAKRSTDSTSIDDYTRQSKTINTVLSTAAAATDMAAGLVGWRKDLRARTRGIVVDCRANSASWATLLGLEIGDRIQHEITPMGIGSQDVQTLTLEAIEWDISGDRYLLTLYGSPIPTDVFVLDVSELDTGRLGF